MRVAYLITAYKNPAQVASLVRALAVPETAFLIHLDRKSGHRIETDLRDLLSDVENCHFLARKDVHWGRFSVIEICLRAIAMSEDSSLDPDHLVFLTGQDFPIKPPEEIATRLSREADLAYVKHVKLPDYEWLPNERGGLNRFERLHVRHRHGGMAALPIRRSILRGYTPYGGSAQCLLGRPHRHYIHRQVTDDPGVVRYFRRTNVPDEIFFQTMLMNSPLRDSVINDDLLFSRGQPGPNDHAPLTEDDLEAMASSSALFARKFETTTSPGILEAVTARLHQGAAT